MLHGAFSTARQMERETGFSKHADEEGFFVAYPNGIGIFGLLQHWNAGHCCGKAAKDGVDDIAYLDAVIDDVLALCPVDENRIYLVGHSNGGMMVYRYAAERSARIAGAAVVSGAIDSHAPDLRPWEPPRPLHPVPMLILHGADDRIVPPEGGESPQKANGVQYASVFDAVDFWERHNGTNAPVRLVLLDGWGHDWPGPFFTDRAGVLETLRGYDAAQTIWRFFAKEQR